MSDAVWWWTTDPATGFFTSAVIEPSLRDAMSPGDYSAACRVSHVNEFVEPDFNKFKDLARQTRPVARLADATGGDLHQSARYRTVVRACGFEHELRVALVSGNACWGAITLMRVPGTADFTAADMSAVASLAGGLAEGLRVSLILGDVAVGERSDGPGLMVLEEGQRVVVMSQSAKRWLAELPNAPKGLPDGVASVVAAVEAASDPAQARASARVLGNGGQWLRVHASRVQQGEGLVGSTAVIIEEAKPAEIAPLMVDAFGLSERERQLTRLVVQGLSTKEIAAELSISAFTVQDHLKSVFDKVGVRSRRELAARLFEQHYAGYGLGEQSPHMDGHLRRAAAQPA